MSIGINNSYNNTMIEESLKRTLKALNRPDILIEESKASTQSFRNFVNTRKKTGIDKSIDMFDPLSQSNSNLQKIDDLYDAFIPVDNEEEETSNARFKYKRQY